jgi:hypothetical protein
LRGTRPAAAARGRRAQLLNVARREQRSVQREEALRISSSTGGKYLGWPGWLAWLAWLGVGAAGCASPAADTSAVARRVRSGRQKLCMDTPPRTRLSGETCPAWLNTTPNFSRLNYSTRQHLTSPLPARRPGASPLFTLALHHPAISLFYPSIPSSHHHQRQHPSSVMAEPVGDFGLIGLAVSH